MQFINDYIETALWSSTDFEGEPLDDLYTVDDIAPEALKTMKKDCYDFIQAAETRHINMDETDHPGHDFWLTRNRHGAGFWDGAYPKYGDQLTDLAHAFGDCDLYVGDDGQLYIYGSELINCNTRGY